MVRLLLLSPSGHGRADGIAAASDALLEALWASGHNAQLICLSHATAGLPGWKSALVRACFVLKVAHHLLRYPPSELVVCHLNLAPLAHWLQRWRRIPYRVLLHGLEIQGQLSKGRYQALAKARQWIAVSAHTADLARTLKVSALVPIAVLPNTYRADRFHRLGPKPPQAPQLQAFGLSPDRPILLTVCRLNASEGYKGVDRVLLALPRVIEAVGGLQYVVAGCGDDLPRLQALASSLGLEDCFRPIGFVPTPALPELYALADAFVMPSTGEGFGIVFLEAMACGTPVLAGNRDGSVDALAGGRLGLLVDPLDPATIAEGIIQLLRREGPPFWFQPEQISQAVEHWFGPHAYQRQVAALFSAA